MKTSKGKPILDRNNLVRTLKVSTIACVIIAIAAIFYFAERYVRSIKPLETPPIVLVDVPSWVGNTLRARVLTTAAKNLSLDDKVARAVAENLASIAWLDNVDVRHAHDGIHIAARWRKPLALIKTGPGPRGQTSFYIDADRVVLDFVETLNLPIIVLKGIPMSLSGMPRPGQVFEQDDLTAALELLAILDKMDKAICPGKPLRNDIDSIDVSNFNGRKNASDPHIVLYAKDNTQIIWGAEIGTWARHLEAKDEDKLAKLYTYYKERGTLLSGAKYINLRDPQDKIPQPIDKYQ